MHNYRTSITVKGMTYQNDGKKLVHSVLPEDGTLVPKHVGDMSLIYIYIYIYIYIRSRKQRLMAVGIRCADHVTPLYLQKLALTWPTGGGRSVGIVHSRTEATERYIYIFNTLHLVGTKDQTDNGNDFQ